MLDVVLLASGAVAVVVAVLLRHLERWSISPPFLGLMTGVLLGPEVLDVLSFPPGEDVRVLTVAARLLLAVALMAVALRYPIDAIRGRLRQVVLLIAVVLPFMAAVLIAGARWVLGLPIAVAAVLGAALSPTDPVLASGIVTGEAAEADIAERDRVELSLESGANDGLAMPLLIIAAAFALGRPVGGQAAVAVYEVVAGLALGALLGWLAAQALRWSKEHREIGQSVRALYTLVVAFAVLGLSGVLRADGLLSVFVAGLVHNHIVAGQDRQVEVGIDESLNQFLVVPVFLLLGVALPWASWAELGWAGLSFVLVALLLRRVPILLALRRPLRASWANVLWLAWFGPIGVAALFYLGHAHEQGVTDPAVWAAGTLVIAVSTVVHGLTGAPGRVAYRRVETSGR